MDMERQERAGIGSGPWEGKGRKGLGKTEPGGARAEQCSSRQVTDRQSVMEPTGVG